MGFLSGFSKVGLVENYGQNYEQLRTCSNFGSMFDHQESPDWTDFDEFLASKKMIVISIHLLLKSSKDVIF